MLPQDRRSRRRGSLLSLVGRNLTAYRVAMAFDAGTIMLVTALIIVFAAIVYPKKGGSRLGLSEAEVGQTANDFSKETLVCADVPVQSAERMS